ncbi:MAG: Gfo/Idh/MocA family protein [Candidatus Ranarchaeia archaeon]
MKSINIGVIGVGNIAKGAHLPSYRKNPHAKITALADVSIKRIKPTARKYKVPNLYDDPFELIEKSNVSAVSICTPPVNHKDLVVRCAEKGIHVLCEKPFAMDSKEAQIMVDAAKKHDIILDVGFSLRFFPNMVVIKDHIDSGKLGNIHTISAIYHQHAPGAEWVYNSKISGGGPIADKGSHVFDILHWWLQSEIDKIQVTIAKYREMVVEELAHIILTYKNKSTALVSLGWLTSRDVVQFTVCGTGGVANGSYRYLEIGYEDLLQTDMYKNGKKAITNLMNLFTIYPPPGEDPYQSEINDFIDAIRFDRPPRSTGIDGLRNMKTIDRVYDEIKKQKR